MHKNQASAYFLLVAIGLLIFFAVTFTFSFRDKVFQAFFDKPFSFAGGQDETPKVDLLVSEGNSFRRGTLSVAAGKSDLKLKWKAENAGTCLGRFWSNVIKSDNWTGAKDAKSGDFVVDGPLSVGIYVYSLSCKNESGDSSGANIIVNVGASSSYVQPHITSFKVSGEDGKQYDAGKLNYVSRGTKIKIIADNLNAGTAYSVCVANGSWPIVYQNTASTQINESFVLDQSKIYKYSLFCSNENGYDSQEVSFVVR